MKNKFRNWLIQTKFFQRRVDILMAMNPYAITVKEMADLQCLPQFITKFLFKLAVKKGTVLENDDGTFRIP